MKLPTVGSILVLQALMMGCTHAFSSLQGAPSMVRLRQSLTALLASSSLDTDDLANKKSLSSWFEQQVQQAQKERQDEEQKSAKFDDQQIKEQETETPSSGASEFAVSPPIYDQQAQQQQVKEKIGQRVQQDNKEEPMFAPQQRVDTSSWSSQDEQEEYGAISGYNVPAFLTFASIVANIQSVAVGAVVGPWAILPITAFHYLVFSDYSYTTYAQWQYDLIAAAIQGAMFCTIYRYSIRQDVSKDASIPYPVILAFVILNSVVRIEVPAECSAGEGNFPLYCSGSMPFHIVSPGMTAEFAMNSAESLALFGIAAIAMNVMLKRHWIQQYPE